MAALQMTCCIARISFTQEQAFPPDTSIRTTEKNPDLIKKKLSNLKLSQISESKNADRKKHQIKNPEQLRYEGNSNWTSKV